MSSPRDIMPSEPSSSRLDAPAFPEARIKDSGMNRIALIVTLVAIVVMGTMFIAFPWMTDGGNDKGKPSNVITGTIQTITYHKNIDQSGDTIMNCAPIATFSVDDKEYIAGPKTKVSPCPWEDGQIVNVLYDEENPENAYIGSLK